MKALGWNWHAIGKRKSAVARVWVKPGNGTISINGRTMDNYLTRATLRMVVNQPLELTETVGRYDIMCNCKGGGLSGQAAAIKHGISRALLLVDTEKFRPVLKRAGFLTRDSRTKERKKYGLRGARRAFQFSKR